MGLLEFGIFWSPFFRSILFVAFILALIAGRKLGGRWLSIFLPVIFALSSTGILFLISSFWQKQTLVFLAGFFFYLILLGTLRVKEYLLDQTGRAMIAAGTAAAIFFAFVSSYAFYLNFLVPLWVLMLVYFFITLIGSFQYLVLIEKNRLRTWTYSLLLSLAMTEIIWTQSFWPFGYLTTSVISLILYYVLWDLVQSYFLNLLSRKRVTANMIILSLATIMVLISAKWLPVL